VHIEIAMVEEEQQPANEQITKDLEKLLNSGEEIDDARAAQIIESAGIDREASLRRFKLKLEKKGSGNEKRTPCSTSEPYQDNRHSVVAAGG
jgi:hypothetical protein